MGADGHIGIYDYDKVVAEIGEEKAQLLTTSTVYIQKLEGRRFLTVYWGDNLYYDGMDWEDRFGSFDDEYKNESWYLSKDEFTKLWSIVQKYRITSWEVWT